MAQMNVKLTDILKNFIDTQAGKRNLSAPAYVRELIVAEQKRVKSLEQAKEQARQKALKVAAENNPFNKKKKQQQQSLEE